MNIYCSNKEVLEDGTIIYEKENMIPDDYDVDEKNNTITLKPKKKIIKIDNIGKLREFNFSSSKIKECYLNEKRPSKNKYMSILMDIYELIDDGTKIIKNTLLNVKTKKINDKGYIYNSKLGISVQSANANKTFNEIVNQCLINKFSLNIEIKLLNGKNIIFNI